jgi:zinc transporter ZupT
MALSTSTEDITVVPGFGTSGGADAGAVYQHRSPRSSALATVSLLLASLGAAAVATGVLAVAGGVLGVVGVVFAIAGLVANRHRHIVGRGNAIIGLVLGVAAAVVAALSVTDLLPGLDAETNRVSQLVEWLDAHASWARPDF